MPGMLNFNQLRSFYQVAKTLSFTAAAKELFITQPGVTTHVKAFEEFCDLKLLKKRGRKVFLTDEGKILYEHARKIFETEKEIENTLEDMRKLNIGVLRLASTKTYARYFMPLLISNFHEAYPHIKIHLDEGSSRDMSRSLLDFRNEIAIVAMAEGHPHVQFIPFSREQVVVIVSPEHPFAGRQGVRFAELTAEPVIMKEDGSGTRKLVNELFAAYEATPDVLVETSNTEFIKQLVRRGEGIAFLVKEAVAQELEEGNLALIHLREPLFLDVSIARLKGQPLSPAAKAFLDTLGAFWTEATKPEGIGVLMARILAKKRREKPSM